MKTTHFLRLSLIFALLTLSAAAKQPNFVFLFTDDHRFDSFGTMGNPDVKTPHMDRLIESGTLFTQAYIQGSMQGTTCLPSRAMIMSGKSVFRAPLQLDSGLLLPQALKRGGYLTFSTGKWHNGRESFLRCFDQAEAVFFGGAAGTHTYVPLNYLENGQMMPYQVPGVHASVLFADAAISFLKSQQDSEKPFFCYVPFTAPHSPYTPPTEFAALYDAEKLTLPPNHPSVNPKIAEQAAGRGPRAGLGGRGGRSSGRDPRASLAAYYGMISHLDQQIGRILDAIKAYGHENDTIVLFATDHGYSMGSHGEFGKANGYEHGARSLISFTGPGIHQGKRSPAFAYLLDIYPTLCDLARIPVPNDPEGESLAGILTGSTAQVRDTLFTAFMADQRTIRDARWKLFSRTNGGGHQLFDLLQDPHELNDLSADPKNADIIQALAAKLEQARVQAGETPERVNELLRNRGRRGRTGRPFGR